MDSLVLCVVLVVLGTTIVSFFDVRRLLVEQKTLRGLLAVVRNNTNYTAELLVEQTKEPKKHPKSSGKKK